MEKNSTGLRITFYGGAEKVTGSNFLVEADSARVLVDCGIEQGKDFCESCNFDTFPYDPASIDALIITHAHLDHVGKAPKLTRDGFKGTVYMTPPTRDLAELILRDSSRILAHEADKKGVAPLYEEKDVNAFLTLVKTIPYHQEFRAAPGLSALFRNTGHILGSASVRFKAGDGATLAITSDLGNSPSPLLPDAEPIPDADVVVTESVYGDREIPETEHRVSMLRDALKKAVAKGGAILIPAFSMERTQLMLYELSNLFAAKDIPQVPVFLDSPLAIAVTDVYRTRAKDYFKKDVQAELAREGDLFNFPFLTMTKRREESERIAEVVGPKIIIAGAGMSHGGRIGAHEIRELLKAETTLLIVGYQAPGSPGRLLQDGAKHIRINGQEVHVRASVGTLLGWSAHADRDGLLAYAESCLPQTHTFFTALGEPASARFFAQRIHDFLGAKAIVPEAGSAWEVRKNEVKRCP